ncbi:MAG: FtsH protease activity modulator HflK [Gammaproteobacteria bacterium]|nr:FtsH protease activity modulator HflK [Gammaproteobacteria bacterium]
MGWDDSKNNGSGDKDSDDRGRRPPSWGNKNQPAPPDLEELMKRLQSRFGGVFGGHGKPNKPSHGPKALGVWIIFAVVIWAVTGFYRVDEGQRGLELRFGKYTDTTGPGLHYRWPPPIGRVEYVGVDKIEQLRLKSQMLTSDENIVVVDLVVQYRRQEPEAYLFNVTNPDEALAEITESAIREEVGKNTLDFVLTEGLAQIGQETKTLLQTTLEDYGTGIIVETVNMERADFPDLVQASVRNAIKAREDKEATILEAQGYKNDILPKARGQAQQEIERAEAYRERVIAQAEGEAKRFELLLTEYLRAPRVTRDRIYYETIETVMAGARKVLVDGADSGNLLYLPLDKLVAPVVTGSQSSEFSVGSMNTRSSAVQGGDDTQASSRGSGRSRSR